MKHYILAGAAALGLAAPAAAQEASVNADLTGPRIEARAGYDLVELNASYDDGVDSFDGSESTGGVGYGGEIGFDLAAGGAIIGAYAGIEDSTTDYCTEVFGGDEACLKAGRNITIGARAGIQTSARGMLYVKGGYSNGRLKATYEDPSSPTDNLSAGTNLDGFHVGAGGEVGFGSNAYAKLEYVYTKYDGGSYEDEDFGVGADLERHQLLLGVGIRF